VPWVRYVTASGHPAQPHGVNAEGLRRRGFAAETVQQIKRGYKLLYKSQLKLEQAEVAIRELGEACPEVDILAEFLAQSERGIIR
jgi:UDP-N-acetylglucosamine acyltransferase